MYFIVGFSVAAIVAFFILYLSESLTEKKEQRMQRKEYEANHNKKILIEFVQKIEENYSGYDTTDKCWFVYLTNEELEKSIDYFLEDKEYDK